jgi:hypothetical protein
LYRLYRVESFPADDHAALPALDQLYLRRRLRELQLIADHFKTKLRSGAPVQKITDPLGKDNPPGFIDDQRRAHAKQFAIEIAIDNAISRTVIHATVADRTRLRNGAH